MSEKRFIRNIVGDIYDSEKDKWFEEDWKGKPLDYDDDLIVFLNEQQATIGEQKIAIDELITDYKKLEKENEQLKELLNLIAEACTHTKQHSVKEILRHHLRGLDTVTGESAKAWHQYNLLNTFFKEQYKEIWDNFED